MLSAYSPVEWFCFSICSGLIKVSCLCDKKLRLWNMPVQLKIICHVFMVLYRTGGFPFNVKSVSLFLVLIISNFCLLLTRDSVVIVLASGVNLRGASISQHFLYLSKCNFENNLQVFLLEKATGSKLHRLPRVEIWTQKSKALQLNGLNNCFAELLECVCAECVSQIQCLELQLQAYYWGEDYSGLLNVIYP